MRCESLKQLYEVISKKMTSYNIVLNENYLTIENSMSHVIKIVFNFGFFDVYIDDIYYHDVDKFDIEETIESIITNYILFKNNSAHIISPKEYEKVIKKYSPKYLEPTTNGYKLTLDGILLSNNILSEFLD